ncbi:MAG: hypothetical protein JJV93_00075 [Alphaproteobacteria bacterium]|nr:hypothetical protein [Alphaproteobacteria bacterium]MBL0717652.1 hypothetical protein [Alphaproteobacteria bacterium]
MNKTSLARLLAVQSTFPLLYGGKFWMEDEILKQELEVFGISTRDKKFELSLIEVWKSNYEDADTFILSNLNKKIPLDPVLRLLLQYAYVEFTHIKTKRSIVISEYKKLALLFGDKEYEKFVQGILNKLEQEK